jgi:hypothetical protein
VFRIAITETSIVGLEVTGFNIRHKLRKPARWRTSSLAGHEFIRRFLQHMLCADRSLACPHARRTAGE